MIEAYLIVSRGLKVPNQPHEEGQHLGSGVQVDALHGRSATGIF
jgi:hypothetical protein